jgi:hypothetical protein
MCHEWKMRWYRERDEGLDQELRYLLDEHEGQEQPPTPILEEDRDDETAEPAAPRVEAGAPS